MIFATLDYRQTLSSTTTSNRAIRWVPLRELSAAESFAIVKEFFEVRLKEALPALVEQLIPECGGHPRSLEAVCFQWKGQASLAVLRDNVIQHPALAWPNVDVPHIGAALSGISRRLEAEVPGTGKDLALLIGLSYFLNTIGHQASLIPKMNPLLLYDFATRCDVHSELAKLLRPLLALMDDQLQGSRYELFHAIFSQTQDICGRPRTLHFQLPALQSLLQRRRVQHRKLFKMKHYFPLLSKATGGQPVDFEGQMLAFEELVNYIVVPGPSNPGFDLLEVLPRSGGGFAVLLTETKFKADEKKAGVLYKEVLDKWQLY